MKFKLLFLAFAVTLAQAQTPPRRVVAAAQGEYDTHTVLTIEHCGLPTNAMRAYQLRPVGNRLELEWGCWGYNESGIQFLWEDGHRTSLGYDRVWIKEPPPQAQCDRNGTLACPISWPMYGTNYQQLYQQVVAITKENQR